jgi:hypothetical protein
MRWRNIAEAEVEDTLAKPEKIEDSMEGRKKAFKHIGKTWLKVTFKEEKGQWTVVTAIDKSR